MRALWTNSLIVITVAVTACLPLKQDSRRMPDDPAIKEYQVSDSGAGVFEVTISAIPNGFGIVWYDTRHGDGEIYYTNVDKNGSRKSPEVRLTNNLHNSLEPRLVWNGERFGLVWYDVLSKDHYQVKFALLALDGRILEEFTLSTAKSRARDPIVVWNGNEFCAAWLEEDPLSERVDVLAQRIGKNGIPIASSKWIGRASTTTWNINGIYHPDATLLIILDTEFETKSNEIYVITSSPELRDSRQRRLSEDDGFPSKYPDIAPTDDGYGIAWYDSKEGDENNNGVYFAFLHSLTDELKSTRMTLRDGNSYGATIAWNGSTFTIPYINNATGEYQIYVLTIDPASPQAKEDIQLTYSKNDSFFPAISLLDGGFGIAWDDMRHNEDPDDLDNSELFFTYYRPPPGDAG